jgi:hypothetical protein
MQITIELSAGQSGFQKVTKQVMQKNIDALQRAVDGKPLASDFVSLLDTKSILEGIKNKLLSA